MGIANTMRTRPNKGFAVDRKIKRSLKGDVNIATLKI
jgi:hypothetical protein